MARVILLLLVTCCGTLVRVGSGAEFRIESKVYVDDEAAPISESTTLFRGGRVYDFLGGDDGEMAIYDPAGSRFILLDPRRRLKTELKTSFVDTWVAAMQKQALGHENEFVRFLADPKFERSFDQAAHQLTLSSQWMTYRIETIAADSDESAILYGDFADAYARLNTVTNEAPKPPFPRLAVNAVLRERKELPKRVEMVVHRPEPGPLRDKMITMRSEHAIAWRLLDADRGRIERAGEYMATFRPVPMEQFRETHAP